MCLILFAWRVHPIYSLVLAANRDEFFARPTQPAGLWQQTPAVVGGRDLEKGGSWLAVSAAGRLAAVTNFRDGQRQKTGTRSRGLLVNDFVLSRLDARTYLKQIDEESAHYDGFNLLVAADGTLLHYAKPGARVTEVEPGIHGLSNHLLDTPWPKVERGKGALQLSLELSGDALIDRLLAILADDEIAADQTLPTTGIALEWERLLSSAFIATPDYGTRASTVVLVGQSDVTFVERNFDSRHTVADTRKFTITLQSSTLPLS
ncbi:MAG: hypothetical protein C5B46_04315 [Proteobacteria bacterium]|nr:MAG: hypothetical protein C5B46_04315 [Pseudomonadota bacterium]